MNDTTTEYPVPVSGPVAAGIGIPADWDARSLWPVLRGELAAVRDRVTAGLTTGAHDWSAVVSRRWKWVQDRGNNAVLLFDRDVDPEEIHNVAGQHPEVIRSMEA